MTIALVLACFNAFMAIVFNTTGHQIACGINIMLTLIFSYWAICMESRVINRIKKLEEELKAMKGQRYGG